MAEGDLQRENFVSFTSDQIGGMLSPLTIFRDQQGFSGRIVASSPSLEEVRRLVIAGYGIGCLPEHVVAADVDAGCCGVCRPTKASPTSTSICCGTANSA